MPFRSFGHEKRKEKKKITRNETLPFAVADLNLFDATGIAASIPFVN